jgi:hypothetical protein
MTSSSNPFPGPLPYRREDSTLYPGRDVEKRRVLDHVLAYRCFALYGPSSAGKSSLMNACILPELEGMHGYRTATVDQWPEDEDVRPDLHILRQIAAELGLKGQLPKPPDAGVDTLLDHAEEQSNAPVVIYLDQLEQLLYPGRNPEHVGAVLTIINELAETRFVNVHVVLALREDYLGLFRHRARRWPRLLENSLRLGPLTVDEMTSAVTRAATNAGQLWDEEQVRSIVTQMCAEGQGHGPREAPVGASSGGQDRPPDDREVESAFVQIICRTVFEDRANKAPLEWPKLEPPKGPVRNYFPIKRGLIV